MYVRFVVPGGAAEETLAVPDPRREEPSSLVTKVQRARGLGLVGMAERINDLGGSPKQAVRVAVELPLAN